MSAQPPKTKRVKTRHVNLSPTASDEENDDIDIGPLKQGTRAAPLAIFQPAQTPAASFPTAAHGFATARRSLDGVQRRPRPRSRVAQEASAAVPAPSTARAAAPRSPFFSDLVDAASLSASSMLSDSELSPAPPQVLVRAAAPNLTAASVPAAPLAEMRSAAKRPASIPASVTPGADPLSKPSAATATPDMVSTKGLKISKQEIQAWFNDGAVTKMQQVLVPTHYATSVVDSLFQLLRNSQAGYEALRKDLRTHQPRRSRSAVEVRRKRKKLKAAFFWKSLRIFTLAMRLGVRAQLVEPLAVILATLMDIFDHPMEINDYNAFETMAEICSLCPLSNDSFRYLVESASRLTLGVPWDKMMPSDEAKMGDAICLRLLKLHHARQTWLQELGYEWEDGKFRKRSTCSSCDTDVWELFLLSCPLAMQRSGREDDDNSDISTDCSSDDEEDAHEVDSCSTSSSVEPDRDDYSRIKVRRHDKIVADSAFLRNFGPNAYVLKIYTLNCLFAQGKSNEAPCKLCGYRKDFTGVNKTCRFYLDMQRAIDVARRQIAQLPQKIDLTDLAQKQKQQLEVTTTTTTTVSRVATNGAANGNGGANSDDESSSSSSSSSDSEGESSSSNSNSGSSSSSSSDSESSNSTGSSGSGSAGDGAHNGIIGGGSGSCGGGNIIAGTTPTGRDNDSESSTESEEEEN